MLRELRERDEYENEVLEKQGLDGEVCSAERGKERPRRVKSVEKEKEDRKKPSQWRRKPMELEGELGGTDEEEAGEDGENG